MINLNNVELGNIAGVDPRDYPDFCDAYFETAWWEDNGKEFTDEELEQLNNENPDLVNETAFFSLVD